ncbi:MAG: carbohydrate ABC transporter permease [Sphaerochaeta sp.]|nr:carbohydrate ABC transporter permease [Sphaerochaeta sp.]
MHRSKTNIAVSYFLIILFGLAMATPFVWMILSSFKTEVELMQTPPSFLPRHYKLTNYLTIMQSIPFLSFYLHTIIITVIRTLAQLAFCSMAAFAFAKMHFKGQNIVFIVLLTVLMVPVQMILVPDYIIMRTLGLVDSLWGVALPGMFSAFGMFLLRQFYMSLPNEFLDAGRIDGCSYFGVFRRLYLPLSKSALISLVIFTVMYSWNDFLWPLIISSSDNSRVLSVGIALLQGQNRVYYNELMAGATMATIPVILIFVFFQRYFVQGIALSGIKG